MFLVNKGMKRLEQEEGSMVSYSGGVGNPRDLVVGTVLWFN